MYVYFRYLIKEPNQMEIMPAWKPLSIEIEKELKYRFRHFELEAILCIKDLLKFCIRMRLVTSPNLKLPNLKKLEKHIWKISLES